MGSICNRELLELLKEKRFRECRNSFALFRQTINPKLKWGWWQAEVTNELEIFAQQLTLGRKPKLVIEAPPQHGKSVLIIDFIAWQAGRNPNQRTIYASFSDRLGKRANLRLQRIMRSEAYQRIFPNTDIPSPGDTTKQRTQNFLEYTDYVDANGIERQVEGFFRNTTVGGSVTGESLDLGIVDDPLRGRQDASSDVKREAVWNWFTDDFFTRFSEDAGLLFILTRWHLDDPVGRLLERDKTVKVLKYKAIAEEDELHRKKGEALFPEHKSLEFLEQRRKIMAPGNWLALYQQQPVADEGEIFDVSQFQIVDAIPAGVVRWCRGWDFGASSGGDFTAGVRIGALPDGRYIIVHVVHVQQRTHKRDATLKQTAAADGLSTLQSLPQDPGAAGKAQIEYWTTQLSGARIHSSLESGDKVIRSEPFAAQVNVGNVMLLRGEWNQPYIDELAVFPGGKYDDRVDSSSRAFAGVMKGRSIFESL